MKYSRYCEGCYNSAFLFNCSNCHDCFGCVNVKNKSYCIFNKQYTKEEYVEELKKLGINKASGVAAMQEKFKDFSIGFPRRFARKVHATASGGDNLQESKNCKHCFDVFGGAEDCTNVWLAYSKARDCIDVDRVGLGGELSYDSSAVYPGSRVIGSRFTFTGQDIYHSYNTYNGSYLFGCVGLRNKQYCILNKQYTKEEYEALVPKIIAHMNDMPYVDKKGRVHRYGEFFPVEISPFGYNETVAQEMYPLTKEEALLQGFKWQEGQERNYAVTKRVDELPQTITEVADDICNEVIECEHQGKCADQCTNAFKIVPAELQFYRQMGLPLPRLCPSCRHFARVNQRNPVKLWSRKCQCSGATSENGKYQNMAKHAHGEGHCSVEFKTTYAPEKPEIVYCEQCYQQEVV